MTLNDNTALRMLGLCLCVHTYVYLTLADEVGSLVNKFTFALVEGNNCSLKKKKERLLHQVSLMRTVVNKIKIQGVNRRVDRFTHFFSPAGVNNEFLVNNRDWVAAPEVWSNWCHILSSQISTCAKGFIDNLPNTIQVNH